MRKIGIYCGASDDVPEIYKNAAISLAKFMAKNGYDLVYGGGSTGLMGVVSYTIMQEGGRAYGYTTELLAEREKHNTNITELHITPNMYERKALMARLADAFVILPGGCGTLDEFFDIFVGKQLGVHKKPIFILNIEGYWDSLKALLATMIKESFMPKDHQDLFHTFDHLEPFFDHIKGHTHDKG